MKRFLLALVLLLAFCPSPAKAQSTAQVACLLTSTDQIIPCWANATYPIGVFQVGVQTRTVQTSGIVLTNLSTASTTTYGDYACTSTGSGVIDNGTNACPANQQLGLIWQSNFTAVSQVNVKLTITPISGGTGSLVCASGSTIASCPISGTKIVGVFSAGTSIAVVNTGGYASVNLAAAATTTLGDYACSNALSAGTIIDNGTSYCPSGQQAGFIGATYGTPVASVLVYLTSYPYNPVAGSTVNVNGATVSNPNFNGTTPSASAGFELLQFQVSGSNVSGAVPLQLGNGTTVIDATTTSGSDQGAKVNAAVALGCATYSAITVDARGFPVLNMAENVNVGIPSVCKVRLLLPETVTATGTARFLLSNGAEMAGLGENSLGNFDGTQITWPGGYPIITSAMGAGVNLTDVKLHDFRAINFTYYNPGTHLATDVVVDFPNVANLEMDNVNGAASYGAVIGVNFGCNCYNHLYNDSFAGWARGLTLGPSGNSINVIGGQYGGGVAIYQDPTSLGGIKLWGVDIEGASIAMQLAGEDANYAPDDVENIGIGASYQSNWASTTAYVPGDVVLSKNAGGSYVWMWVCEVGGTSGNSSPFPTSPLDGQAQADGSGTLLWRNVQNPYLMLDAGSAHVTYTGPQIPFTDVQKSGDNILNMTRGSGGPTASPLLPSLTAGRVNLLNSQFIAGGLQDVPITFSSGPTLAYHCPGACSHTTTYYYYMELLTPTSGSGLTSQSTLTNGPDTIGVAEAVSLVAGRGGAGYPSSGTATLNCSTPGTQVQVNYTATGGVVQTVSISNGGTYIAPQECGDASPPAGNAFAVNVDSNYIVITPPLVNTEGSYQYSYQGGGTWSIIGRTNVSNVSIGGTGYGIGLNSAYYCPSPQINAITSSGAPVPNGSFCDLGWSTVAYTPAARNQTGDVQLGLNQGGAAAIQLGINQYGMLQGSLGPNGTAFQLGPSVGSFPGDLALVPSGSATSTSLSLCLTAACGSGHYMVIQGTSTGLTIAPVGTALPVTITGLAGTVTSGNTVEVKTGATFQIDSGATYTCNASGCSGSGTVTSSGPPSQYQIPVFTTSINLAGITPSSTSGVPLISQGSSSNPAFGTVAYAGGGTNATTQGAAALNLALYGSTAVGDILTCTHVTTGACDTAGIFAGNSSGTRVPSQNSSGTWGWLADSTTVNGTACTLGSTCTVTVAQPTCSADQWVGNNTASGATASCLPIGSQDTSVNWYAAGGGSAQAQTVTLSPAATSLAAGLTVVWKPTAANTAGGPTLAVNGLTATTITKCGSAALVANDLLTTAIAMAVYDGTQFELLNPQQIICAAGTTSGPWTATTFDGTTYQATVSTNNVVIRGGQNSSSNSLAGGLTATGADNSNNGSSAGPGYLVERPGLLTGTSPSGLAAFRESGDGYLAGTTVTQWNVQHITASGTVQDTGASATDAMGVASNSPGAGLAVLVITSGIVPINATAAVTAGHTVCTSATGGQISDSGGVGACTLGQAIGKVAYTSGAHTVAEGNTTGSVTCSTTLPCIQLQIE